MLKTLLIFFGLSLDGFIVMMQKGATVRDLSEKNKIIYSLAYMAVNLITLAVGYGLAVTFDGVLPDGTAQIAIASMLIMAAGIYIAVKSFLNRPFIEKLDSNFNIYTLIPLAFFTNIKTMIVGIGFALLGVSLKSVILPAAAVTFLMSYTALSFGYSHGAAEQRLIGIAGGTLMVILSAYTLFKVILAAV